MKDAEHIDNLYELVEFQGYEILELKSELLKLTDKLTDKINDLETNLRHLSNTVYETDDYYP